MSRAKDVYIRFRLPTKRERALQRSSDLYKVRGQKARASLKKLRAKHAVTKAELKRVSLALADLAIKLEITEGRLESEQRANALLRKAPEQSDAAVLRSYPSKSSLCDDTGKGGPIRMPGSAGSAQ